VQQNMSIDDKILIFASHLAIGMISAVAIIFHLLCLSRGRVGRSLIDVAFITS